MMGLGSGQALLSSHGCRSSCSLFSAINAAAGSKENPAGRETLENCSPLAELVLSHFIPEVPAGRADRARLPWGSVTQVSSLPQTSMPMFRSKQFSVKRRFSDFLGLYEKLSEKHAQNGFIVPPPPEKSLIGE